MSIEASIKIKFTKIPTDKLSPIKIILSLIDKGWTFNDYGACSYLPIGENEGFEWVIQQKISIDSLMNVLKEKECKGELIGIIMTWQKTNIGGAFLIRADNLLSISLTVNRKTFCSHQEFEITDVNWYLERLLPAFNQCESMIEYFTYEEHI